MQRTQIYLTEEEREALSAIAGQTGRSQSEIIREAVDRYIGDFKGGNRLELMKRARGLWKARRDLPDFAAVRRELDRAAER